MSDTTRESIRTVAVVGCGTVGASWTALFLAHGLDVRATDPSAAAEERLNRFVERARPQLAELGATAQGALHFTPDLADALAGADFVQENAPENEDLKRRLLADIDAAMTHGPGLRWAIMGPHMTYHLGGGEGGIERYLAHLGPSQARRWASLGTPVFDEATRRALADGVRDEAAGRSVAELEAERDRALVAMLKLLGRGVE